MPSITKKENFAKRGQRLISRDGRVEIAVALLLQQALLQERGEVGALRHDGGRRGEEKSQNQ